MVYRDRIVYCISSCWCFLFNNLVTKSTIMKSELKYTYVDFVAIKKLDISINEYIICDIVYKLQAKEGYCYAANEYFAKCLNMTARGVIKMLDRLIDKRLIIKEKDRGKTNKLTVANLWHETVIFVSEQSSLPNEQSSQVPMNKVPQSSEQSSYNNNIYNNKDNNINNTPNDWQAIVLYFYSKIAPETPKGTQFRKQAKPAARNLLSLHSLENIKSKIDRLAVAPDKKFTTTFEVFCNKYSTLEFNANNLKRPAPIDLR